MRDGTTGSIEVVLRRSLLLVIFGLFVMLFDLRIQGFNLIPDSVGAALSVLGIRKMMPCLGGLDGLSSHLRRALIALLGAALFMIPDIYQATEAPSFVVQFYPASLLRAAFWTGSFICELAAVLSLSLAVGAWGSIINDDSLAGLSRVTFRSILGVSIAYAVSLSLFLVVVAAGGGNLAGFFAVFAFALVIAGLISRILLFYSLIRVRRASSMMAQTVAPPSSWT